MSEKTYWRTPQGSHRHADWHCANALRSIFSIYPIAIAQNEANGWEPCGKCCGQEEIDEFNAAIDAAAAISGKSVPVKPAKCSGANLVPADSRRLYRECADCGRIGKVDFSTGRIRAHAAKR